MREPRKILMLAFPGAQSLDVTGPLQMFAAVNDELRKPAYAIAIAAPEAGPFATSSGIQIVADLSYRAATARRLVQTDTLMVAGGDPGVGNALEDGRVVRIVASAQGRVRRIASVCSGAFVLAAAGLLDGRRATTHWRVLEALRQFRPAVTVDDDAIHVEDRGVWTSAGVTAGMDLALAMIEADHGRHVALSIARRHVIYRVRPGGQSQFSAELAAQGTGDKRIAHLLEQIERKPDDDWRIERLSAECGLSLRSLSRHFRAKLDTGPAAFVERARLDIARRLLLETDRNIETIARSSGFGTLRRMDRAFARTLAITPSEFRSRFKSKGGTACRRSTSVS